MLDTLTSQSFVEVAAVYDGSGKLFSSYVRSNDEGGLALSAPPAPGPPGVLRMSDRVRVIQRVRPNERMSGTVVIVTNTQELVDRLRRFAWVSVGVLSLAGLVSISIVLRLQKQISEPMQDLAAAASQIAEVGDYSIRAVWGTRMTNWAG